MFLAAKLLAFATQPLAWVVVLLFMGLVLLRHWRRTGTGLLWAALALLVLMGWQPLPDALLRPLEQRHAPPPAAADLSGYAGVIVLGGALEPAYVWEGNSQPALNDGAERMVAALPLLQRHPHWTLLFTGGEGELFAPGLSEAERARRFFAALGVAPPRLRLEAESRTTYENAVFSAALPGVDPRQPWLLLTSAWHMPRALATFRRAGWNVTPYPVDYRSGLYTPWTQYSLAKGAALWHLALHEYAGLLAYRLAGRL